MRRTLTLVAGMVLLAACADAPSAPGSHLVVTSPEGAASIWAETVTGETGPGSLYALYKPVGWNGEVVYYAHGFVDAALPPSIPGGQDNAAGIRDALGAMGYAVAMSSFSSNGYDFPDGLRRMHQLRGLVRSNFGVPTYNWLAGHSLGAQISQAMAEQYGSQYDGALLMCGVLGGSRAHFQWLGDIRVLFDFFYPGVLPGDVSGWPANIDPYTYIPPRVVAAVTGNPAPLAYISAIHQTPLAGTTANELVTSLVTDLIWHARGIGDVTDRTQGHMPYGNIGRVYTGPAPLAPVLAAVNAGVGRFASPRDAQNWLERNYEPAGTPLFPVLTMHTLFDQSVPYFHEGLYGALVTANGNPNLLAQRTIVRYGHCSFTMGETLTAFVDLVNWVKNGVTPTP